jgi:hypothetical protein
MSINTKSIFEMSAEELRERLKPMAETIKKRAWDRHSYISYYDEAVCPGTDFVIREYRDRKELVQLSDSGAEKLIRAL